MAHYDSRARARLAPEIALGASVGLADLLARAVSIVCAPPIMMLPLVLLVVRRAPEGHELLQGVLAFVAATAVLPALFVYASCLVGAAHSFDLTRRSERLRPAVFAVACATLVYPVLVALGAPPVLLDLDAALAGQLALLAVVTAWWKISYHAAGAAGVAFLALALEGASLALPLLALAGLVGWARVHLGRHTRAQVFFGWLSALPLLWWTWNA